MPKDSTNSGESSSQEGKFQGKNHVFLEIPVERILTDPHNPRIEKPDKEREDILEKHLEVNPVVREPLIVQRTDIRDGGTYLLIDGERRYRAARKAGFETVPCDVYTELDGEERQILRSIKNFGKEKWTAYDEMVFLTDQYENWKANHPYEHDKEETRREAFCNKFDVTVGLLGRCLTINASPIKKQKLKEGWAIDKVLMIEADVGIKDIPTLTREAISDKIVKKSEYFQSHVPSPTTDIGKRSAKSAMTRTQGEDSPTRDTLSMAKRTVRAEVQPTKADKSEIARNNILDWLAKVAVYNTPIKTNIPLLESKRDMKQVLDNLQAQIKDYQNYVRMIAKRGNFKI
jgi:ParB/RepB/Spo0J family partition protein